MSGGDSCSPWLPAVLGGLIRLQWTQAAGGLWLRGPPTLDTAPQAVLVQPVAAGGSCSPLHLAV